MVKEKVKDCRWKDSCRCRLDNKTYYCSRCPWYRAIDSGYGFCLAMPEPIIVAWCKDICSFYGRTR